MCRVYDKLRVEGDNVYQHLGIAFKSSWFPIYYALTATLRALTVTELTEQISYTRITVKNVIRELEQAGHVTILPNPLDSRSKLVQMTVKAKRWQAHSPLFGGTFIRNFKWYLKQAKRASWTN